MSEKRSILDAIKSDIAKSGGNFKNLFAIKKAGDKVRVRFLVDFEDGIEVVMHTKWQGFQHPCLRYKGVECPNCDSGDNEVRTQSHYCWPIYNYETKQQELFFFKASRSTPLPALGAVYETLGDIISQDIVIQRNGTGTDTSYAVIPTGKIAKLAVNVKPFTKKKMFEILFAAFNTVSEEETVDEYIERVGANEEEDDDEEEIQKKSSRKANKVKSSKKYDYDEDDEDEIDEDEEEEDDDYDEDLDEDEEDEEELPPPKKKAKASVANKSRARRR